MIKEYQIDYEGKTQINIQVNHDVMTDDKLREINQFWSGSEERLESEGSVLNCVLKLLTNVVLLLQVNYQCSTPGIVTLFDYDKGNGQEGWPKMDGSEGIELVYVDEFYFEHDDMCVEEVAL